MDAIERLNRRLALAAGVLALLAALAAHAYLAAASRRPRAVRVPAVAAARSIPAHTVLTAAMLRLEQLPPAARPPGAFPRLAPVLGAITTAPLYPGQVLVAADLSRSAAPVGLDYAIPPGRRAYTLSLGGTQAVGDMVRPGDHVDVLLILSPVASGLRHTTVLTLLQDVPVLAVGQRVVGQGTAVPRSFGDLTLQVTPRQAELLAYAAARGQITLTLRGVTDHARPAVAPVSGSAVTTAAS